MPHQLGEAVELGELDSGFSVTIASRGSCSSWLSSKVSSFSCGGGNGGDDGGGLGSSAVTASSGSGR